MQLITDEIRGYLSNGSWIRKMFEAGLELKKQYGEENVYDFSIGNPDLPPPPAVKQALAGIAGRADRRSRSAICRTPGYPALRKKLAGYLSKEQKIEIPESNVIMTCGAAGGINVFFRAVLSAGDEVICPGAVFRRVRLLRGQRGRQTRSGQIEGVHLRAGSRRHREGDHRENPGGHHQYSEQSDRPDLQPGRADPAGGNSRRRREEVRARDLRRVGRTVPFFEFRRRRTARGA